jgi:hypothetical protein
MVSGGWWVVGGGEGVAESDYACLVVDMRWKALWKRREEERERERKQEE